MTSMTTNLNITPSTTTSIEDGKHPYEVVPDRLIQIDGVDYVRCDLHGLIPLDHYCAKTPHDHWCRQWAHPNYDDGDGDQGRPWEDEQTYYSIKTHNLAEALLMACLYLEGFVWVSEPEFSEMEAMKQTCAEVLGCKNWTEAMELARLRDARRKATE